MLGWLVVLRINVDLAIFQPYLDLEAAFSENSSGEAGNRTPVLLFRKPRAKPLGSRCAFRVLNPRQ